MGDILGLLIIFILMCVLLISTMIIDDDTLGLWFAIIVLGIVIFLLILLGFKPEVFDNISLWLWKIGGGVH